MRTETAIAARTLPNGKPISALGFGCASVWSKPGFPAVRAVEMLELAVAEGINHFDTSPSYADGEARLGNFLRGRDPDSLVLSTKVGTEYGDHARSFDPVRMLTSLESSLKRLGVSSVDILYLHGPSIADLSPATFAFFEHAKTAGLIRYAGVNSFDPEVVAACIAPPEIDAVMLQYSISDRRFDQLIEALVAHDKIVVAGTVMAQGIFDTRTFVPRNAKSLWYLLRALKNDPLFLIRGRRLARRLAKTGLNPHNAALRFAVSNSSVTSSLFGTSSPEHLVANARAGREVLTEAIMRAMIAPHPLPPGAATESRVS